jgi:hypothetical protein
MVQLDYNKYLEDIHRISDCEQACDSRSICNGINCIELCECLLPCNKELKPENCLMRRIITITKIQL